MMIYVSHPFTGDEQLNREKARIITARLAGTFKDIVFINPLDVFRHVPLAELSYEEVLKQCIDIVFQCNGIIMTGKWKESTGCIREYYAAMAMAKPIYLSEKEFVEEQKQVKGVTRD